MFSENIGVDIVEIKRISRIYKKFSNKFLEKIFNVDEINYISKKSFKVQTIAAMFSFKESISKALGTGFGKELKFKDINIYYTELGKPFAICKNIFFDLSASHDGDYVVTVAYMKKSEKIFIEREIKDLFIKRRVDSHKGTFGRAMVIASSKGMVGAGYLSSLASQRSGCGYTYHYVFKEDDIFLPLSIKHTEVILREDNFIEDSNKMDAILFGPGLGMDKKKKDLLEGLIKLDKKLVIDADGLNLLAENIEMLKEKKADLILTPHILEFKRLINNFGYKGQDLLAMAKNFAKEKKLVLVLKDSKTYITDGYRDYLINRPNSGLATAGSGDVLAGIIVSLLAQGYSSYNAALLGANIHSLAGLVAVRQKSQSSLVARDIIDGLDFVFKNLEEG